MFQKSFPVLFAISLLLFVGVFEADAYFFSATDGLHLILFEAVVGNDGKLTIVSRFQYDAPGRMGNTALIPSPKSTSTKLVFDLFGTYDSPGKPIVFRDRVEYDLTASKLKNGDAVNGIWSFVSRKKFLTQKVDSFNLFSAAASEHERLLLTKNGLNVNSRVVSPTGSLKGKNKPTFKNSPPMYPFSAAFSSDGEFAAQSFSDGNVHGLSLMNIKTGNRVDYRTTRKIINTSIASNRVPGQVSRQGTQEGPVCFNEQEEEDTPPPPFSSSGVSASSKIGVFYVRFDPLTLLPIGKTTTISRMKSAQLGAYRVFNTTTLLPDGTGIVFAKEKNDKLEYFFQPLNGSCGPKIGKSQPFLTNKDPLIAGGPPVYGLAAAAAWCFQVFGVC